MALAIRLAETAEDLEEVRTLLREYVEFIAAGWPEVDRAAWAEELRDLREMYPIVLLAHAEDELAACVMLRDGGEPGTCEVRRLYVRSAFRRRGVARELTMRLMSEARRLGYATLRLVAVKHFEGAIPLYESLGFRQVEPYRPSTMPLDTVRFMERELY